MARQERAFARRLYDIHDGQHWLTYILGDKNVCPDGKLLRNLVFMFCGDGVN